MADFDEWKEELIKQLDRLYGCWQDVDKRCGELEKCVAVIKRDIDAIKLVADRSLRKSERALNLQKIIGAVALVVGFIFTVLKIAKVL